MFVLVLMLRQSITFLRTRGFSSYLPLDQHIYFHKLTGTLIAIYSVVHTISHLLNFSKYNHVPSKFSPFEKRQLLENDQDEVPIINLFILAFSIFQKIVLKCSKGNL